MIAPESAAAIGSYITLIDTTEGTSGTTFLGSPQGSYVNDTAGNDYIISYTGAEAATFARGGE